MGALPQAVFVWLSRALLGSLLVMLAGCAAKGVAEPAAERERERQQAAGRTALQELERRSR